MILKLNAEWTVLFKQRKKDTGTETKKREGLKCKLRQTCWVVNPDYEKKLAESTDLRKMKIKITSFFKI